MPARETEAGSVSPEIGLDQKRAPTEEWGLPAYKDQVRESTPIEGPRDAEQVVDAIGVLIPDRGNTVMAELAPEEKCVKFRDRRVQVLFAAFILIVAGLVAGLTVAYTDTTTSPTPLEPATPKPTVCEQFEILNDTDLLGSDIIGSIPLSYEVDKALEECKKMCVDIPTCKSFTMVEVGAIEEWHNTVPWCFVKSSIPNWSPHVGMTSGVLTSAECPNVVVDFSDFIATDFFGWDLFCRGASKKIDTLDAMTIICRGVCGALPQCEAFTAVDPAIGPSFSSYSCCVKYGVPAYVANPYANSGIKLPND